MISKLLKDVPYIKLSICKQNYALPVLCMLYEDMFIHVAIFGTYQDVFISMIFSKSHNGYITTGIPWWANSYDIWYILCYLYFDIWYVTWCVHSCDIRNIPWCVYSYDIHCENIVSMTYTAILGMYHDGFVSMIYTLWYLSCTHDGFIAMIYTMIFGMYHNGFLSMIYTVFVCFLFLWV